MSKIDEGAIDVALQTRLRGMTPAIDTKKPGIAYKPNPDRAWQRGTAMCGDPEPVAFGDGVYSRMFGIFQVDLFYPKRQEDTNQLYARAKAVVARFWPDDCRGLTLIAGTGAAANNVYIEKRPSVSPIDESDAAHNRIHIDITFRADDAPAVAS